MAKVAVIAGDKHIPYRNDVAWAVLLKALEHLKPDIYVNTGDEFAFSAFSRFQPVPSEWDVDLEGHYRQALEDLDEIQKRVGHTVYIEGNHDARIEKWAAATREGMSAYRMLSPRIILSRGRKRFRWVPYYVPDGTYSYYRLTPRISVVHGWTYCKHATARHLEMSRGRSIIHGHTHRMQVEYAQDPFSLEPVEGFSAGCLCDRVPLYNTSAPVNWVNGFIVAYIGRRSDTVYTVPVKKNFAVLPDGTEIRA